MDKSFRFKTLSLVFMIFLAIPFYAEATELNNVNEFASGSVEPYGPGEWDPKGQETDKILGSGVGYLTKEYTATDGGNFKIDMQSTYRSSNYAHVTYYVNGVQKFTLLNSIDNYKGSTEISGLPAGAKVQFFITVDHTDTFTFKFYD